MARRAAPRRPVPLRQPAGDPARDARVAGTLAGMEELLVRSAVDVAVDEAAARRTLRAQLARLERELSDALIAAFGHGGVVAAPAPTERAPAPRLLSLGELEAHRDRLTARIAQARRALADRTAAEERARIRLERMLLEPGRHRFERVTAAELGEGGCGVYEVRPRLGLIGMLAGWWQVKLSSGCPLATRARPLSRRHPSEAERPFRHHSGG
ncbi:MAG TPA: hypothetical protein VFR97_15020 [Capillimicrobium sp.]|nr:hypothetical protein [Capillimicrobium sp.]